MPASYLPHAPHQLVKGPKMDPSRGTLKRGSPANAGGNAQVLEALAPCAVSASGRLALLETYCYAPQFPKANLKV